MKTEKEKFIHPMPDIHYGDNPHLDGVMELLTSAKNKESSDEYDFHLKGDLKQMAEQKKSLVLWGFDVQQNDVYPSLKRTDVKRALDLIWGFGIDGWWHYKEKYILHGICSDWDFQQALFTGSK